MDQINNIGKDQERLLGNEKVAILVFVDDVMSAGMAENARKSIHNMAVMEKVKKFTYGLKKTKFMVVDSAKGQPEEIKEEVKGGTVGETSEYKYVGFWVNKKGNCLLQIEKKKQSLKAKGEVNGLKSVANYYNVGETFVNVRLEMYEQCILQSLLYNMEAWSMQTKGEIKRLEQIQSKILNNLLELPKTTPYIALLNELGIWRIEERLVYRKLMKDMIKITTKDDEFSKNFKRLLIKKLTEKETSDIKEICREMKCSDMQTQTDPKHNVLLEKNESGSSGSTLTDGFSENSQEDVIDVVEMAKKVDMAHIQPDAVCQVPLTTVRVLNLPHDFGVKEVEDLFGLNVVTADVKKKVRTEVFVLKKNKLEVKIVAPVIIADEIIRFHGKKLMNRELPEKSFSSRRRWDSIDAGLRT